MSKLVKEMQVHVILHDMDYKFSFKNVHENENFMLRYATIELSTLYRTQPWQFNFIPWNISIHLNVLEKKTPYVLVIKPSIWVIPCQLCTALDLDIHRFWSNLAEWLFQNQIWILQSLVTIGSLMRSGEANIF